MNHYTIRVVLHDYATADEYELLRSNLSRMGAYDEIQADDGTWYRLPPAEYTCATVNDAHTIRDAVMHVARQIKPRVAVLVSDSVGRYWQGLESIPAPLRV